MRKFKNTFKDLTNCKFGRLQVIKLDETTMHTRRKKWICQCDCGSHLRSIRGDALKQGSTQSCGCIKNEKSAKRMYELNKKYNDYYINEDIVFMKAVNCDEYFIFDLDDLDKVLQYTWFITEDKYVKTNIKNKHTLQIHKLITNTNKEIQIDHIVSYTNDIPRTLNNLKSNLRHVTNSQNQMNRKLASNNTSGVVGVSYSKQRSKWRAYIKINNKYMHLGYYNDFQDAVKIRSEAEIKYFGEYRYKDEKMSKRNDS